MYVLTDSKQITFQLGPWLAVEIPELIEKGIVVHKDDEKKS